MNKVTGSFDVTLNADGSVRFDARKLCGADADLVSELNELASLLTGKPGQLTVEKHVHRHGVSHHEHTHLKVR
ncbi:MAG: hypothetical protein A2W26_04860 [Acidobacteria bacterium RBG_16_64_8]|nr:MAG: hypothetical protein A2W26_04860 [Acidobacteria bacterium RBG_16_64_8]